MYTKNIQYLVFLLLNPIDNYILQVYLFCGHLLLSYALAFVVSATCEAPVINIISLFIKK